MSDKTPPQHAAEVPNNTPAIVNQKKLWKVLGGDCELLKELLAGYREACPEIVSEIRQGVHAKDSDKVQRSAHKLKGMVGSFAAEQAYSRAKELEYRGRDLDFDTAETVLQSLEKILAEVDTELSKMAESGIAH